MSTTLHNVIPRPNMDLALHQTRCTIKRLEQQLASDGLSEQDKVDITRRLTTLRKWEAKRALSPRVPPEYRAPYRGTRGDVLGYKHPGMNFNFPLKG